MAEGTAAGNGPKSLGKKIGIAVFLAVLAAMVVDTKVVPIGGEEDFREQAFAPDAFGTSEFPRIQALVLERAVEAAELATAITADRNQAIAEHGTMPGAFPLFPVRFTGTAGEGVSGIFPVEVEGLPDGMIIRVQTGPAINGTELRDIPGDIEFGAFTNQIEYQDAGSGINRAMSRSILQGLDRDQLQGQTVSVVGVFTLINPTNWLVTPVEFDVQ